MSLVMFAADAAAVEQSKISAASSVQKASFDRAPSRDGRQRVTFGKRPARVGDEVEQTLALETRSARKAERRPAMHNAEW
jgi:hypothetical protein